MNSLRDRMHRLKSTSLDRIKEPEHKEEGSEWENIGAHIEKVEGFGSFILRKRFYSLDYQHGHYNLGELNGNAESLSAICGDFEEKLNYKQMFFMDTETTGLGVGAGNVAFMIGFGYYTDTQFVVEQGFIRNPSEELALLCYLQEKIADYTHLVSYNGRTFDWPIIRNRYIMNRMKLIDAHLKHIDLLYPSRALWRNSLPSCRLGTVEQEKLNLNRVEDVPGSLAPSLYFQYLSCKDTKVMEGVFEHNEQDILTLASLSVHYAKALHGEIDLHALDAEELYRMGVWLEKMGEPDLSESAFELLLQRPTIEILSYLIPLAELYKKRKNDTLSIHLWERVLEVKQGSSYAIVEASIELAKFYEHRLKNLEKALHYAEVAKQRTALRLSLFRGDPKQREVVHKIEKRIDRLRKKNQNLNLCSRCQHE